MNNIGFLNMLDSSEEFSEVIKCIENKITPVNINGVAECSVSHLVFCVCEKFRQSALLVFADSLTAQKAYDDLHFFYPENTHFYPDKELIFYEIDAAANDIISSRLNVLKKIKDNEKCIIVTTISAIMSSTAPKNLFDEFSMKFSVGDIADTEKISDMFITLGYSRVDMIEGKGQFCIRGGIIDYYSHHEKLPVRIELFGDEIDSLRTFDIYSQRSVEQLKDVEIPPASEIIMTPEKRSSLIKALKGFMNTEDEAVRKYLSRDIEKLENSVALNTIDKYLPLIYKNVPTILDYIDESFTVFVNEPKRIKEAGESAEWRINEGVSSSIEKGIIPPIDGLWTLDYTDAIARLSSSQCIGLSAISNSSPDYKPARNLYMTTKTQPAFHGKPDFFYRTMREYKREGWGVIVLAGTEVKAKNITEALCDEEIHADYALIPDKAPDDGQIIITCGELSCGTEYPLIKRAIITDREIFGSGTKKKKQRRVKKNHERLNSYTDLSVGDYVVHQNHGIGRFAGIKTMTVDNATSDYLQIDFNGTDRLYVPANQLDLLYKYIGKNAENIKLNKLGGTQWLQTKLKVKNSCAEMAEQLISLYAARQQTEGIAFSKDGEWHSRFAGSFPYDETDDQLRAIAEITEDMEKPRPMERLLCGDVGYGKTEVALRAAFKAVMDGYQVAYLAPTTILAQQIYNTFCDRMKDFPISIGLLSRFRSKKEQENTIADAKKGLVDIVVGTHRILQKDIGFKKLGLLITDEEQRFGVAHKERLKELKNNIDVLTLSATPIPRTLHMSMVGIRDMSVLENPPADRYPVSTYVLEYNPEVIKEAVLREVGRGGQVYYLHNRVSQMDSISAKIRTFSPDLRVATAHGKMAENELESIMDQLVNHEIDVLVCTTIIETGLDIPNVNTIILEDADKMGLAQLYQLRGRVGRSNKLAYCYLTYKRDKILTEIAEKRLRTIRDFTEFGSGFKIAMRDLEIRGAGNVVGARQHGHMDAVGYDMYCKLLGEAVSELKGDTVKEETSATINLGTDAYIPKNYIKGENYRIEIYKKISAVENQQDAYDIYDEICDRYGSLPKSVENLIEISLIQTLASQTGAEEIVKKQKSVVIYFSSETIPSFEIIGALIEKYREKLVYSPSNRPYLTLFTNPKDMLLNIKSLLQDIKILKNDTV